MDANWPMVDWSDAGGIDAAGNWWIGGPTAASSSVTVGIVPPSVTVGIVVPTGDDFFFLCGAAVDRSATACS